MAKYLDDISLNELSSKINNNFQKKLHFDNTPTRSSPNPVISGGIYDALTSKESTSNKVTAISSSSTDTQYPSAKCVYDAIAAAGGGSLYLHNLILYNSSTYAGTINVTIFTNSATKISSYINLATWLYDNGFTAANNTSYNFYGACGGLRRQVTTSTNWAHYMIVGVSSTNGRNLTCFVCGSSSSNINSALSTATLSPTVVDTVVQLI